MNRVNLAVCIIETRSTRRPLRRRRWTVTVTHLPSGIIGTGLNGRSYEEARDGALRRIESLLQTRDNASGPDE